MTPKQRMAILNMSLPPVLTPDNKKQMETVLKNFPDDFGPNHPDWKIPSRRNKFLAAKHGIRFATPMATIANPVNDNPYRSRK